MNEAALESKEELENFKKDAAEPETSKSSKNAIDNLEESEENNHQNYEEDDDDDDFGDFEEAPQAAFNRVNIPEKEDELDCQNAFKDENCSTSQQQAPTSSTTKPTYLTIKDIIEQPELMRTMKSVSQNPKEGGNNLILIKSTTSSNSIFNDLFKQMDNIEQINLMEKKEKEIEEEKGKQEDEGVKEDEEKTLRRHSSIVSRFILVLV
ncbi:unnamed protein product [Meloidogyne enterolobii]|uniref:Uncharacterized protein n=2 Tax=Meloidogyne enterolobii TaxID=390850 RepID=A0ACB0Y037_MELEN